MNPDDVKLIEQRQCPECARLSADLKAEMEHRLQCQNELFVLRSNLKAHCDAIEHLKQAKAELEAKLADRGRTIQNLQGRLLRGEPDVITHYQGSDGSRDWRSASAWLMPGQALAVIDL